MNNPNSTLTINQYLAIIRHRYYRSEDFSVQELSKKFPLLFDPNIPLPEGFPSLPILGQFHKIGDARSIVPSGDGMYIYYDSGRVRYTYSHHSEIFLPLAAELYSIQTEQGNVSIGTSEFNDIIWFTPLYQRELQEGEIGYKVDENMILAIRVQEGEKEIRHDWWGAKESEESREPVGV
jgi:hypothetical protein